MTILPLIALLSAAPPEVVVQVGSESIDAVAFSADGRLVATGGLDQMVKIWDVRSARLVRGVAVPSSVTALAFDPAGAHLVAGTSGPGTVVSIDVATGEVQVLGALSKPKRDKPSLFSFGYAPVVQVHAGDGVVTAIGSRGSALSWRVPGGEQIEERPSAKGDMLLTFIAHDPKGLVAVAKDPPASIWRFEGGAWVPPASPGKPNPLSDSTAAVSPDGKLAAVVIWAGGGRLRVDLIEVATGKVRWGLEQPGVRKLAFAPDGSRLISVRESGWTLLDTRNGKKLLESDLTASTRAAPVFAPDGRHIAVPTIRELMLVELPSGAVIRRYTGLATRPERLNVSRDGRTLVVGSEDGVDVWDLEKGTVRWGRRARTGDGQLFTALDADERVVIARAFPDFQAIDVLERATGKPIDNRARTFGTGKGTGAYRQDLFLGRGGKLVAFTTAKGEVLLFDAAGKKLASYAAAKQTTYTEVAVAFSPDGARLAFGRSEEPVIFLVDLDRLDAPPREIALDKLRFGALRGFNLSRLFFTPDGKDLVVAERGVGLLDLSSGHWRYPPGEKHHGRSAAFDGASIALGTWDGTVELFDAKTGRATATLSGHASPVEDVAFVPGGGLVSASRDGTVRLWDLATGKWRVALASFASGDAAAVTPEGHYSASRGALRGMGFRIGARVYPFDQFDLRYNRPDLVLAALGHAKPEELEAYRRAWQRRLQRMGIESVLADDFRVPDLTVDRARLPLTTPKRRIELEVEAKDDQDDLATLLVSVNDVPERDPSFDLRGKKQRALKRKVAIELGLGLNRITVSVRTARGAESLREVVEVVHAPPGKAKKRDVYLVAIGVSKYAAPEWNLDYAAKDARDVARALGDGMVGEEYGRVRSLVLTDQEVTKERIAAARKHLAQATVDDAAIVFVAGHGVLGPDSEYWFATHDLDFAKPEARGVAYGALEQLFEGARARRRLMLIDTCHSGEDEVATATAAMASNVKVAARGVKRLAGAPAATTAALVLSELFADVRRSSGAIVISSASASELAWESEKLANGVFTYAVLTGLYPSNEIDRNKDQRVEVSELRDHVFARVRELTGGRQTPTARYDRVENDFPLR